MTEQAAQDPNMPELDPAPTDETAGQAETAPATVEKEGTYVETDNDKVQARINKITAEKYAEKRRADELERKLSEVQPPAAQPQDEPKLEDFDYDETAYTAALIDYKVGQQVNQKADEIQTRQSESVKAQAQEKTQKTFNDRVAVFTEKAADYQEVIGNIPELPVETFNTIMHSENGPELAYYLGKHLDVADELANADPMVGAMKLGQISAQLAANTTTVKTSAAPSPIEPIDSGGVPSRSQEDMSMDEIYNMK